MTFVLEMFDSHNVQDVTHFDSLILSNTFLCNFLFVIWLATLAFMELFMFPTTVLFTDR